MLTPGFPEAFRWPFARLFAFKDGQRRLQDGFWTRLRQFRFKMEPGRPKAPPRFSQDGSKALLRRPMTDPKSTKIHEKWVLRAIPILVSFFVRFSIDFQSMFRPPNTIFHSNYTCFILILCFQDLLRSNRFLNACSYQHGSVFDSKNRRKTDKW